VGSVRDSIRRRAALAVATLFLFIADDAVLVRRRSHPGHRPDQLRDFCVRWG